GETEANQFGDASVFAPNAQTHPRAEAEAAEQNWPVGKFARQIVESGANVILFAAAVVVCAFAESRAAKIQAQHRNAPAMNCFRRLKDPLVVHRAAKQGMRVADDRRETRICVRNRP